MDSSLRKIVSGGSFFLVTCTVAVIVYQLAGWDLLDAIYMVVITIFGVGYGEVRPIHEPGLKVFTMGLIIVGCSSLIYVTGGFIQMITEGEIQRAMGVRKVEKDLKKLSRHVIVCGFGRVGRILARELKEARASFVVIDTSLERIREANEAGYLALLGDASDETVLLTAGADRARALATVLPDDTLNVFITLTAREISRDLEIIARAEAPSTEKKLMRSGASRVVLPSAIGAARIAQLVTCPTETELLHDDSGRLGEDLARLGLKMTEVTLDETSPLTGQTLAEVRSRSYLVAAIVRSGGEIIREPDEALRLEAGDRLLLLARESETGRILERVSGKSAMLYRGVSY
ncbi:MAG: potassium channel protein [Acidobacteria bacterium]|nr:potassium channel protein [Acidobacteriota bacterium]